MGEYLRPSGLPETFAALENSDWTLLAGGTDFYPARVGKPVRENVLDITGIGGLRGITETDEGWRIGATTTWTDIVRAGLPTAFDGLKRAAGEVGGVQIQNAGTICGNVCNASPAADGVPALLSLDAEIELGSLAGIRRLKLQDFILGNRRTALKPGELVTALLIPRTGEGARGHFLKLGSRRYLVISIVMAAAVVEPDGEGRIARAAVSVGACSEVACRLPALETALRGMPVNAGLGAAVTATQFDGLSPIGDVRGSADYRREAAMEIVGRLLDQIGERA